MTDKQRHALGIAFCGGGPRGYYHLGVLKRLLELGYVPETVSGTSVGSIVAAYFAQGFSIEEMLEAFNDLSLKDFIRIRRIKDSLVDSLPVRKILEQTFRVRTFEELQIPAKIVATCLETAQEVVFQSGPLIDAVMASCSIPVIFPPVKIHGKHYVDGGVLRNVPVKVIREDCKRVFAVNLFPMPPTDHKYAPSVHYIAERSVTMLFHAGAAMDLQQADLVIEDAEMARYSAYDLIYKEEMFDLGYNARALKTVPPNAQRG